MIQSSLESDQSLVVLPGGDSEPAGEAAAAGELEWSVHLAKRRPGRVAVVLLAAAGCGATALLLFGNPLFALAGAGLIVAATAEFLFPIRYRLTADAAESRNGISLRRIRWADVKKAYLAEDGVKLSPLPAPSRLENTRGVFLRFNGNDGQVVEAVKRLRAAGDEAGPPAVTEACDAP